MSADHELHSDYKEWRRLAETEGEAIRTRNWRLVADCQKALQQLQGQITGHILEARKEWAQLGLDRVQKESNFCTLIVGLIEIESRNHALLRATQQDAKSRLGQLEQAGRMLRRVQSSYAPARPAAWTSLS
jgi:hypothetical protein